MTNLLFCVGILTLVINLYQLFEGSLSLLEISAFEVLFFWMMFEVCRRHYLRCKKADIQLNEIVIRGVVAIGCAGLLQVTMVVAAFYYSINSHLITLISWLFLASAIFLAAPKKSARLSDDVMKKQEGAS